MSIVNHCLKDAVVRKHVISKIGRLLQSEIAALCSYRSESVLRCQSNEQILSFEWERVIREMQEHAPTLLNLLHSATHTRRTRPNRDSVIAMCTVMMCKLRNSEVSAAQKIVSLILFGGHASKQVCYFGPI